MRDYLFRGKTSTGVWVYGSLINVPSFCCIMEEDNGTNYEYPYLDGDLGIIDGQITPVIPETVGQFTGVCDKNGKKIFEGDIVSYLWDKATVCMLICFKDGEFCMKPISANQPGEYWEIRISGYGVDAVIVDNIHGVRELLKGVHDAQDSRT